jgi:peroxiredoxin
VADRFGVWGTTKWGEGILRTTFIIERGRIKRVFESVKPQGHAAEVLAALGS